MSPFFVYFNMRPTTNDPKDNGKYMRIVYADNLSEAYKKTLALIEAHEADLTERGFHLEDVWGPCLGSISERYTFERFLTEDHMVHVQHPVILPKVLQPTPAQAERYQRMIENAFKRLPN